MSDIKVTTSNASVGSATIFYFNTATNTLTLAVTVVRQVMFVQGIQRRRTHGAKPPSFTVQPNVPVNVARAATAAALYFMVGPMSSVNPDCSGCAAHAIRSAS